MKREKTVLPPDYRPPVPCPKCRAKGEIWVYKYRKHHKVVCPECEGSGERQKDGVQG